MKYIEYKNLCQGKPENNKSGRGFVIGIFVSLCIWLGILTLCSCTSAHYSQRFKGHVTSPPVYLIAELPGITIMQPQARKITREPKERKSNYIMPQYLRITNYEK